MNRTKHSADHRYSELEVISNSQLEVISNSQLEVIPNSQLEVIPNAQPNADQLAYPGIIQEPKVLWSYWRRKWRWFILFGVIVIGAIVEGVVGGLVGAHKDGQTAAIQMGLGIPEGPFPLQLIIILITWYTDLRL